MNSLSFSRPVENPTLVVASFGGGVQSTRMLLGAAHGEITPMPDYAIISGVGPAESQEIRDHIRWMASGNVLPFPIIQVDGGDLEKRVRDSAAGLVPQSVPFFVRNDEGTEGMLSRNCTRDFKISPAQREIKRLLGLTNKRVPAEVVVEHWIGFGADELIRCVPSGKDWDVLRWPLVELRESRGDSIEWLKRMGYPVPRRSRCKFCPYTSDEEWQRIKDEDGDEWREAVEIDRLVRRGMPKVRGEAYVHRTLKPLDAVTFDPTGGADLFNHVCRVSCGT